MDISEVVVKSIVDTAIGLLKDRLTNIFKSKGNEENNLHERLAQHMREIQNWSKHFQFFEMPFPRNIDLDTVKLSIQLAPRRFHVGRSQLTDESVFFNEPHHYVLLGEPGSGKTTTLKRLVRKFFEESPLDKRDILQYPVVLILRDYDPNIGLFKSIADAIGVQYEDIGHKNGPRGRVVSIKTVIGKEPIREKIADLLDASKAFLLLDGLDEVPYDAYNSLIRQLNDLSNCLDTAKILLTCRSGDFTKTLEGFKVLELAKLSIQQVDEIARMWLGSSEEFMRKLSGVPYRDIAHRPLLLA